LILRSDSFDSIFEVNLPLIECFSGVAIGLLVEFEVLFFIVMHVDGIELYLDMTVIELGESLVKGIFLLFHPAQLSGRVEHFSCVFEEFSDYVGVVWLQVLALLQLLHLIVNTGE
jgi:hypothetical protein